MTWPARLRALLVAATALLLAGGCSKPSEPGRLDGRVLWQGAGVGMALVEAYPKPERDPATPPVGEGISGDGGLFHFDLPPGQYWVWGRVTVEHAGREVRRVGEASPSPVQIRPGETSRIEIVLADPTGFSPSAGPAGTGASGIVAGAPGGEVTVYAYPGRVERPVGPSFAAAVVPGAEGSFRIDLVPGPYALAARWRASGDDHGALTLEDRVAFAQVEVRSGDYADAGVLALRPVDRETWQSLSTGAPPTPTWVAGLVADGTGRPVAGVRVLAFTDPRMAGKPAALTSPTDADGAFRVYLPSGGVYFLGARSRLGGPAEPGEKVGAFRGEDGSGLRLAEGDTLEDLTITVEEVW